MLPDFHDIWHMKVVRFSASRTGRLYPQEWSWYSFLLGAESIPRPWYGQKEYVTEKPSDTRSDTSVTWKTRQCTVRIEACSRNQCWRGNAISITNSDVRLYPLLSSIKKTRMSHITLSCGLSNSAMLFHIISLKNDFRGWVGGGIHWTTLVGNISHSKKNPARYWHTRFQVCM
jgi:hypothetical protein